MVDGCSHRNGKSREKTSSLFSLERLDLFRNCYTLDFRKAQISACAGKITVKLVNLQTVMVSLVRIGVVSALYLKPSFDEGISCLRK